MTERFSYSPIADRPKFTLPGDARVALWVVPNVEHYEYLPKLVRVRDPWPRMPHPDVLNYGLRDYGNRVGLWRLFEVMDKHAVRCTVSLSLSVIEHYPEIHEAMQARHWEYMSHGLYNTRYHWNYTEEEERAAIQECQEVHRRVVGKDFAGWFSPAVSNTLNTPDLVAEAGIKYICDLYHDDQPTPLRVRSGKTLISVPYTMDLNDGVLHRRADEGAEFAQMMRDHFDTVYREGVEQPRVMCIALHPYYMGAPHRIRHLDAALGYILGHDGVWCATGEEIADWYLQQHLAGYRHHLGAEA